MKYNKKSEIKNKVKRTRIEYKKKKQLDNKLYV